MEYPMENKNRRHSRLSVGVGLFLTCLVLTTIIGLFGGLLISNYTHNNYVMYAEKVDTVSAQGEVQREIVASSEEAAAKPDTEAANAAADTQQADAKAGSVSAFKETGAYTKAQIVEMSAPSVVGIDTITTATTNSYWYGYGQSYEVPGSGSGVILTEDGYIATCAHVVDGAKSVKVTLNDDTSYDATIVGTDKQNDIAIIKIEATGLTPAIVGDSETLTVGSEVIAIGNPLGELRGTATAGIIDAAISPGNSGGGLFDATGKLIGIVNAKVSDSRAEGLGFAIPVNSVLDEISDLLNYGYVTGRPYLGVSTQDVTLRSRSGMWYYSDGTRCVMVEKVVSGSAAEQAGIQSGDLILKLGDKTITSGDELSSAIGAYKPGDKVTLTIQRDGQEMTMDVTLGEYKPQK